MVNWKAVIIGLIIAVVLGLILHTFFIAGWGGLIAFVIAGLYVGYASSGGFKSATINGAVAGIIIGIISAILATFFGLSAGLFVAGTGILRFIAVIIIVTIVFAICGGIGAAIKGEG